MGMFLVENSAFVLESTAKELLLVCITFSLAVALGLPLGLLCYRNEKLKRPLLELISLLQTLPALALFGIFVAIGRQGLLTTLLLALIYTLLPVIFGTDKGLHQIDRPTLDAALGMGMTYREILFTVMLPLASPQIFRGVRKAMVAAVGMVTIATIPGGGLGFLIMEGMRAHNMGMALAGALPACLLALLADLGIGVLEKIFVPVALRRAPEQELFISK